MYPLAEGLFAAENCWYVAAWSNEITRAPMERWFLDRPVVLYRDAKGSPVALSGHCPHRHFPLARGIVEGDNIRCGYHGQTFAPDGTCVSVPGQKTVPAACHINRYPVAERWQWVWIWMGDPELADASLIPDHMLLGLGDPQSEMVCGIHHLVRCRYMALHDNLADLTHLSFLHQSSIGSDDIGSAEEVRHRGADWIGSHRTLKRQPCPPFFGDMLGYDGRVDRAFGLTLICPSLHVGYDRFDRTAAPGAPDTERHLATFRIYHAITPATRNTTHYFFASGRDFALGNADFSAALRQAGQAVLAEDIIAVEALEQMVAALPAEPQDYHVQTDTTALFARRIFEDFIRHDRAAAPHRQSATRDGLVQLFADPSRDRAELPEPTTSLP
ncbi:aromatic ring-hydroxylating dioxygenase subunit alpha [Sphingomonas crusticola]|uniref:aromatic ring-hydroxylating dioxygenase subunit alpha n=1 Tax=Sphingomonas crusticola TaxID=1697973 RepID=UPI000E26A21C|nr:aromatic ring-hydroxylating dioxygenase subunit alpha [Sphingomonas crusticola]